MFDIGFFEILIFGAIALIVLGPEKLPQAIREAGRWYAKIRFTLANVQHEIETELNIVETRRLMQAEIDKIKQSEKQMQRELAEMRSQFYHDGLDETDNDSVHIVHTVQNQNIDNASLSPKLPKKTQQDIPNQNTPKQATLEKLSMENQSYER